MAKDVNPFSTPEGILEVLWRDGYHAAARLIEQLLGSISKDAEMKFLKQFAFENCFDNSGSCDQLRCLWTAYCFHHGLDVDTADYDSDLRLVWAAVAEVEPETADWSDFESFDQFMCKELV